MRLNPSVTEVARNFAEYINRVAFRGERFVLMRGKRPVAELRPVPAGKRLGELSDLLDSLPRLGTEEADHFGRELNQAASELEERSLKDPCES